LEPFRGIYSHVAVFCQVQRTEQDTGRPAANPAVVAQLPRPRIRRFLTDLTLRRAIGGIMVLAVVFTLASAALMRLVEPKTYHTYGQACWWAVQTVSTVGYGDNVPVTDAGRFLATAVMIFGIALIPATTSLVVAVFINQQLGGPGDQE